MNNQIAKLETSGPTEVVHSSSLGAQSPALQTKEHSAPSRRCAIVGGTTLAVHCAQQLVASGHVVQVVLATDAVLKAWANHEGILCVDTVDSLNNNIRQHPVDWLFSVVNPFILPASLIENIRNGAFNYHDAPLPRYAGTHATSWALLAHESHYAITWHYLTAAVDAGHIAVQRPIVIDADETALTLNLKCYQAARESFNELLSGLSQCSLVVRSQDPTQRSFYAKHRRPPAGAYLRWTSPARDLSALVRALTFGELYLNPLGCPKLLLQQGTVQVARVTRLDQRSSAVAGTVISIKPHAWQISTGSEDVLVSGFSTLEGEPLPAQDLAIQSGISQGDRLPELTQKQADSITEIHERLAPHEAFWQQRLACLQPLQLPFGQREHSTEPEWVASAWCPPLQEKDASNQTATALLTVFSIYLARLTAQTKFQIGWHVNEAHNSLNALACLASVVPMDIVAELDEPFAKNLANIQAEYARLEKHRTFVRDLASRSPVLRDLPPLRAKHPWPVAVSVLPNETQSYLISSTDAVGTLITLQINSLGAFRWVYDANRLDAVQVQRISEHIRELGHASLNADHADKPAKTLNLLPSAERELLLNTWNATQRDYPAHSCVHQLFEAQVARLPEATALVHEGQKLSYIELNAQANRLAHQLIELGVKPDARVAICVERSPAIVVGLLAILKAGGAYVPLDPAYPRERLAHILQDAVPQIVLADTSGRAALGDAALANRIVLDPNTVLDQPDTNPRVPGLSPSHLAYVIYTSGSTGTPKGVMAHHQGVVRLIQETDYVQVEPEAVFAFASNVAFDAATFEIWAPLLNGARIEIIDRESLLSPSALARKLKQRGVTVLFLTTALFNQIAKEQADAFSDLHYLLFGGEAADPQCVSRVLQEAKPRHLLHVYGPTETVTYASWYEVRSVTPSRSIPIGRPIANTSIYLLDTYGQPVPLGAVGELYIGGAGVSRGYLNRPDLTAERFVPDRFSATPNARMYKTGDLARYLPDGNLEFIGRNDHQVKIRGFRIELGEIEACLAQHAQVREAVVLALGDDSKKRLVAYVVAEANDALSGTLRAHVSASLPEYMVPSAFVRLNTLPLTPNGKLDRRALPAPDAEAFAHQAYEAPQGKLETTLAQIWSELLGVEHVGRHDSFFALGGHSLLAVQMIERLRRLDLTVSVRTLFNTPTLSKLAQSLGQHCEVAVPPNLITLETTTLTPQLLPLVNLNQADIDRIVEQVPGGIANIQDIYALSPMQDGILFHHLLSTDGDPYLLIAQMAFDDRAMLDRYLNAVQQVINRHDILRTAFFWEGLSTPAQVVWRHAPLAITELALDPEEGQITEQLAQRFDPRQHCLDLTQAPLLRFVITQNNDGRWLLVQLLHHLVHDHSTLEVMHAEVKAFIEGRDDTLPPAQPFRNLVAQAYLGISQVEHERFFTEMLADVEEPTLPFGLADVHHDGTQITEAHQRLPQALNDRLRAQAKRLDVSLASLCHLAWAQVLARASSQQRVVFGTVLFGRMHAGDGADSAMGLFVNTLPLRVDLGSDNVADSVRNTQARLAALLEHEHASLTLAQRCSSVLAGTPLFSALLNYRHNAIQTVESETSPGIEFLSFEERTNYPLILSVDDFGTALGLTAQIAQPFDPAHVCSYMQQALESLVEGLEYTPDMPVCQLEILSSEERKHLLKTWNATTKPYPKHMCIHQLFEAQVEHTPQATALVCENQTLNYAQLNAQANHLAHRLIELGVQPDVRVAICVERSLAMVVGLLAILKAGGAYVPLDPGHPSERLAYCLKDAAPAILLADAAGRAALGETILHSLTVLDPAVLPESSSINPNVSELTPSHLAYVIYTSGSTGAPKGVMIEHAQIVRLFETEPSTENQALKSTQLAYSLTPTDRVLQKTPFSFDVSLWEIFWTLMNGATLVVAPPDAHKDPFALVDLIIRQRVTTVHFVPSMLRIFLNSGSIQHCTSLKQLICSGEALSSADIQICRALLPQVQLHNLYGPTETSIGTTVWTCPVKWTAKNVLIGRPIANTRVYLLDARGQPVPLGAVGELYIGGEGVARGYLNRPQLTAECFVHDPFSDQPDARMYKTGDLARYLPDGNLEFLGRNDHQVKIRGFRIELGEIEACLARHAQVRDAVVLATGEDQDKRLVAYVIADADEQLANTLRIHLAASLPEYMVPSAFVQLNAFPLTPSGKLDRRALPVPDTGALALQKYEAPQGQLETTLADVWGELLGVERVGRQDSFFALGGHSLLAIRMIERIRITLGIEITILSLFETPTIAGLVQRLVQKTGIRDDAFAVLLPIQPTGTRPPLFCVHPVSGLSWLYRNLINYLDTDQPVYGLQARGLNGASPLAETIDEMAADYIKQIRRIQPNGPYHLLGWSFGGNVVHSMASQLEQQGESVSLLALLDSYPDYAQRVDDPDKIQKEFYIELLSRYGDDSIPNVGDYLWGKTRDVIKNNHRLLKEASIPIYCGDALFFYATIADDESIPLASPDLWKPYILKNIEICNIHCKHRDMGGPGPATEIGQILAQRLSSLYVSANSSAPGVSG
ncbi:amino acid adenylation domain-containing protein [Mycetohabitans sp. B2]|uniref:non-ribosomal peptide synthetase n=1 Tax=Mycetohabitans sp. B2 TaxID=2841274 RepID=UPI001F202189|nr:non-ribosomal peptide synthetase [Mycetohabitans sp. B2]MCF7696854.1 amino acid adenylation domain-containing protein [Mycetohabitans sp. B2]